MGTLHPRIKILTSNKSTDFQLPQSKNSPYGHPYASHRCVFSVHTIFFHIVTQSATKDFSANSMVPFYMLFQIIQPTAKESTTG